MIKRLKDMGINDKLFYQLYMILTNREVIVQTEQYSSQFKKVRNDAIQGAPCSCLLAELYAGGIGEPDDENEAKITYIDNTTLLVCVEPTIVGFHQVQRTFEKIYGDAAYIDLIFTSKKVITF